MQITSKTNTFVPLLEEIAMQSIPAHLCVVFDYSVTANI